MARKKNIPWQPDFDPEQGLEKIIHTLENFWIPLLEEALEQAKKLLSKLKQQR